MKVSKQQVVEFIRDRGDSARAEQADADLPDVLDLPTDQGKVTAFGVDPLDLAGDVPDHGGTAPGTGAGAAADE